MPSDDLRNSQGDDERLDALTTPAGALTMAAKAKLQQMVSKIENLNEEIKGIQDYRKDAFAEAKAMGYDVKALRTVIRERAQDAEKRREQEAINDVYRLAMDMDD